MGNCKPAVISKKDRDIQVRGSPRLDAEGKVGGTPRSKFAAERPKGRFHVEGREGGEKPIPIHRWENSPATVTKMHGTLKRKGKDQRIMRRLAIRTHGEQKLKLC